MLCASLPLRSSLRCTYSSFPFFSHSSSLHLCLSFTHSLPFSPSLSFSPLPLNPPATHRGPQACPLPRAALPGRPPTCRHVHMHKLHAHARTHARTHARKPMQTHAPSPAACNARTPPPPPHTQTLKRKTNAQAPTRQPAMPTEAAPRVDRLAAARRAHRHRMPQQKRRHAHTLTHAQAHNHTSIASSSPVKARARHAFVGRVLHCLGWTALCGQAAGGG